MSSNGITTLLIAKTDVNDALYIENTIKEVKNTVKKAILVDPCEGSSLTPVKWSNQTISSLDINSNFLSSNLVGQSLKRLQK